MNVPWACQTCGRVSLIDLQKLDVRPVNRIVNKLGYVCFCGEFVEIRRDSGSFRELENKLKHYRPDQKQYQFLLQKISHKAMSMMDRDYN